MVVKILAYIIYFSPYVFCIGMILYYVITFLNIKKERKCEEERRKEMNREIYVLALELRRLNNRLEVYAIRGNEYEEVRGKRAMPGKEKIPINTVVIVKILYRDKEIVMSNIVRAIHDVVNVLGNFFIFPNN